MSKFLVSGDLAAHWLAIMQNVIQALLYGDFILVMLTMLLPSGHKVIVHYLRTLLWVQFWSPLYAILNLVMTMGAGYGSMAAMANTTGASAMFTLNTYAGLGKVNADMAAFAGFATLSIPLIAWGMMTMTSLAVTVLASSLASMSQSVASQVGGEMTSGNFSYGNLQYQTASAYNTSANSFNTNDSQSLVNWMMTQSDGHGGQLGAVGVENILNSQPALAQAYANQFVSGEVNKLAGQFAQSSTGESTLRENYETSSQALSGEASIVGSNQAHNQMVQTAGEQAGLNTQAMQNNVKNEVNTLMNEATKDRRTTQAEAEEKGNVTQNDTLTQVPSKETKPVDMTLRGELSEAKDLAKGK